MRFQAHFRDRSAAPFTVDLTSERVHEAISEAQDVEKRLKEGYLPLRGDYVHAFLLCEITDEARSGYTVWENEALCGVRGWQ